jgi:DNA-binding NtrC family response regulator
VFPFQSLVALAVLFIYNRAVLLLDHSSDWHNACFLWGRWFVKMSEKKRILILDDEPSITFSLSRCLQSESVHVISCNDSQSARSVIAGDGIDAVIADVRLSAVNSRECLDFIQFVRSRDHQLPLIMMSGNEDLMNEAMQEGANYFFHKPVDVDELIHLLQGLGLEVGQKQF